MPKWKRELHKQELEAYRTGKELVDVNLEAGTAIHHIYMDSGGNRKIGIRVC